jgi:hypothetical protein
VSAELTERLAVAVLRWAVETGLTLVPHGAGAVRVRPPQLDGHSVPYFVPPAIASAFRAPGVRATVRLALDTAHKTLAAIAPDTRPVDAPRLPTRMAAAALGLRLLDADGLEWFEERAAVLEYDAKRPRWLAELVAAQEVVRLTLAREAEAATGCSQESDAFPSAGRAAA